MSTKLKILNELITGTKLVNFESQGYVENKLHTSVVINYSNNLDSCDFPAFAFSSDKNLFPYPVAYYPNIELELDNKIINSNQQIYEYLEPEYTKVFNALTGDIEFIYSAIVNNFNEKKYNIKSKGVTKGFVKQNFTVIKDINYYEINKTKDTNENAWVSFATHNVNTKKIGGFAITLGEYYESDDPIIENNDSQSSVNIYGPFKEAINVNCIDFSVVLPKNEECIFEENNETGSILCYRPLGLTPEDSEKEYLVFKDEQIKNVLKTLSGEQKSSSAKEGFLSSIDQSSNFDFYRYYWIVEYSNPKSGDTFLFKRKTGANFSEDYGYSLNYSGDFDNYEVFFNKVSGSGLLNFSNYGPSYLVEPFEEESFISGKTFKIKSMQLNEDGFYDISFLSGAFSNAPKKNSYLVPKSLTLEGSYDGNTWNQIYKKTGINWEKVPKTPVSKILSLYFGPGDQEEPSYTLEELMDLYYKNLFSISGLGGGSNNKLKETITLNGNIVCQTSTGDVYSPLKSTLVFLTGDCSGSLSEDQKEEIEKNVPSKSKTITEYYLRTGYKFNPTGDYNFYRLYLGDLNNTGSSEVKILNKFKISNVNFYGELDTPIGIHEAEPYPVEGVEYELFVSGLATGFFTGISSEFMETSGFNAGTKKVEEMIVGAPLGLIGWGTGDCFETGNPINNFTGFLSDVIIGSGNYTIPITGFYYNTGTNSIYFYEYLSGYVVARDFLFKSGVNVIKNEFQESISNIELSRTESGIFNTVGTLIFPYESQNIKGFGYHTGLYTGQVLDGSGFFHFLSSITGLPNSGTPLQSVITGKIEATGSITFLNPSDFDTLSINSLFFAYQTNNQFLPPIYFQDISGLVNNINAQSQITKVKATISGLNKIFLSGLDMGEDGNLIALTSSNTGAFELSNNFLIGGQSFRPPIFPTGNWAGEVNAIIPATGYFFEQITGIISTAGITGTIWEDNFSGTWTIATGTSFSNLIQIPYDSINERFEAIQSYPPSQTSGINIFISIRKNNPYRYNNEVELIVTDGNATENRIYFT